jgi:hypothetical protein
MTDAKRAHGGLKPGDTVIRTVARNNARAHFKIVGASVERVREITQAGYIHLCGNSEKFNGDTFPIPQYRPRSHGIAHYRIHIYQDTPRKRGQLAALLGTKQPRAHSRAHPQGASTFA